MVHGLLAETVTGKLREQLWLFHRYFVTGEHRLADVSVFGKVIGFPFFSGILFYPEPQ